MNNNLKHYAVVTGSYWAFTITDGAIRMLVVLYFHLLGYSPLDVAMLFLFYEFFGVVTNLIGGWLAARLGLNVTMHLGMGLQIVALCMLTAPSVWLSVPYVMAAQALSGIAKDLNKMSAKASVKMLLPDAPESGLFKWVAVLTGSKNALKGAGFFIGALLLDLAGFRGSLLTLVILLVVVLMISWMLLPRDIGRMASKPKFSRVFSPNGAVNRLAAARLFLFGSRDVWFVVALPLFLYSALGWTFTEVGSFFAVWIIGYGLVQAVAPRVIGGFRSGRPLDRKVVVTLAGLLSLMPAGIAIGLGVGIPPAELLISGLALFGVLFALNSAVHSYLILAYSDLERVSLDVGFYYMANAGGRLTGTILSGLIYQRWGLEACLYASALFVTVSALLSLLLPESTSEQLEKNQP